MQLVYSDEFVCIHSILITSNPLNFQDKYLSHYTTTTLAQWIGTFETLLMSVENGDHYFCGRDLLYCDLLVFDLLELNLRLDPTCLDHAPKLSAFRKR